ncbi:MAG: hypothetical protein JWN48_3483 [Myxococcaceae bacterium]|nr:hypothetical protein [Myxococcaceae bacterium]
MRGAPEESGRSTAVDGSAAQGQSDPLALVLDRISDAITVLDRDDCYTYMNAHAARLFGRPASEMLGQNLWALFPDAVGQAFHKAYQHAVASGEPTTVENYYAAWDRWIESRIYPAAQGVSIFFHDVSERKRDDALLRGQTRILEQIAHGASLGAVLDALLVLIESQCRDTRGSILLLDRDGVHLHHGAAPSLPDAFTRFIDGAEIGPSAGSCGAAAFHRQPVMTEDIATDPHWEDWREQALALGVRACWSTPILDDTGRVLGTFAMYYDAPTARRERDQTVVAMTTHLAAIAITHDRDQSARRQSESRYRCLVESNLLGVMIVDRHGLIKEANDELLRIFGRSRDELEAGALRSQTLTAGAATDEAWLSRLYACGTCSSLDCEGQDREGHPQWFQVTAALVEGSEDAICLIEDVTARREQARIRERNVELEESKRAALEASRLKSEFLASMSHELRTPLNAIIGFSELLADGLAGELNPRQGEYVGHVLTGGTHLLHLINDVLDLAKIEAGKVELFPVEFELEPELEEVCSVARALAKHKEIEVRMRCQPALDRVTLDLQKFKQVLFNLLANAVRFTREGGLVELEASASGSDRLEIRVRDNGIGIRREDLPKLFHEFSRVPSAAKARPDEGTGLGLVLAKKLVESQHGQIGVESRFGHGTTFQVVLPRVLHVEPTPSR